MRRFSFRAVYNSFFLPCRFPADTPTVLFLGDYLYVSFLRMILCPYKKSMEGDSPLSISFSGEYLSVLFLKEISESFPFSFRAVLRKESHGILIPNILDPHSLP